MDVVEETIFRLIVDGVRPDNMIDVATALDDPNMENTIMIRVGQAYQSGIVPNLGALIDAVVTVPFERTTGGMLAIMAAVLEYAGEREMALKTAMVGAERFDKGLCPAIVLTAMWRTTPMLEIAAGFDVDEMRQGRAVKNSNKKF